MKKIYHKSLANSNELSAFSFPHSAVKLFALSFTFTLLIFSFNSFSQNVGVAINVTGNAANTKALLDVDAAGMSPKAGVLIPRMNTAERNAIASPVTESLLIYNTDTHCFEAYYGGAWVAFGCLGSGCPVPAPPAAGINTACQAQIVWNWQRVSGATSYQWNTVNTYPGAGVNTVDTSYTQTGLTCNTAYTLYIWAYNSCGTSSSVTLTQSTIPCGFSCGCPFTDVRDGQSYNTVSIGTQCWMAQNLNYGTYTPETTTPTQSSPYNNKWCYHDSASNCSIYGGLYQWADAMTGVDNVNGCDGTGPSQPPCNSPVQGICPTGWHIPSMFEWVYLEQSLCSIYNCSTATGSCAGDFPWDDSRLEAAPRGGSSGITESDLMKVNVNVNPVWDGGGWTDYGNNASGFSALPAGSFISNSGFSTLYMVTGFWISTIEPIGGEPYNFQLVSDGAEPQVVFGYEPPTDGISVRCVKN